MLHYQNLNLIVQLSKEISLISPNLTLEHYILLLWKILNILIIYKALHDIFNTKLKNKYYYLNNKEQTFLCINLDTNYDEKDGEGDESISSETTSCGYDTSTSISTSTFSNDDYSTIDSFADHGLGVIWTNTKEHGEFGTIIVDYYFLKKFFDFND
ncbi:uncharacterized protein OCT59_005030 [Rhizophagus irregularis]|uniref:Uncharacterized protein n=1 Tax=Rhizophagus irregularis (strain DAOM 181602 / DAOM 197198 / MUCL 43194) TaxID=747089 RepID=A0A2H5RTP7_RHIID|nr:hypothetical protein GLOIN_2v1870105 [Rhizophagus irregularis DAOM 181602=DAOM 197198]POG78990.1 hypothetical protein GLOIN_2v1870105 [Rhizophagus irregularis DAOM 181602=DAOM 197198]UZO13532.1 hypothetical protein OCT59_005030 [Rhizophagus irregularis]GBC21463.1 hypothetical protein GLOIN_2v1870105 [Rhizophagus irregularis DAOM 181602=DAOM 197198]CAG8711181.1 21503_t:CDS:1 [Rhizophagus irregularis]|eukprot:XP_025185856.1 hypothetical protein GLOIN_2v1870105 [Rhizophagus irregularis DAOM 181602=DAOM 197198]